MNILIITQMYSQPDDKGDNKPTKTVNYFAKEWVKTGNQVIAIHCSSKFPLPYYWVPSFITNHIAGRTSNIIPPIESRRPISHEEFGVKVYRIPMLKWFPGQAYSKRIITNTENTIRSILVKENFIPDIIIGHFANPSLEIVCNLSDAYHAMSSIVFHHDCNEQNIMKYRMNDNLRKIGAIGVRSMPEKKEVLQCLPDTKSIFLCYSGVPQYAIDQAEKVCSKHSFENGIRHIYVGSMIARKHVDSTIKAFVAVYSDDQTRASLEIVGGGAEEQNLKALVRTLHSENAISFLGRVDREEVLQKMREANIFTLISDDEVYGMVYIEAMLQGCLVIASKGGGFDGIIVDGENGFLCNPGDSEMLANIYKKIENMSIDERNQIGQRAINSALHFSEEEVAKNYLNDVIQNNA